MAIEHLLDGSVLEREAALGEKHNRLGKLYEKSKKHL